MAESAYTRLMDGWAAAIKGCFKVQNEAYTAGFTLY